MAVPKSINWNDEQIYTDIENAVADGAESISDIAQAIGCKLTTFRGRCYPTKGSTPEFFATSHTILTSIKKGKESRRENMKASARRGLKKLLEGFETVDTVTEKKTVGQKTDANGRIIPDIGTTTIYKRENRKQYAPNATAVIFALCNLDSDNYKSLYRAGLSDDEDSSAARHGAIAQWMREQAANGSRFNSDHFPGVHDSNSTIGD